MYAMNMELLWCLQEFVILNIKNIKAGDHPMMGSLAFFLANMKNHKYLFIFLLKSHELYINI